MKFVYENYEQVSEQAFTNASSLTKKFNWNTIMKSAFDEIGFDLSD